MSENNKNHLVFVARHSLTTFFFKLLPAAKSDAFTERQGLKRTVPMGEA